MLKKFLRNTLKGCNSVSDMKTLVFLIFALLSASAFAGKQVIHSTIEYSYDQIHWNNAGTYWDQYVDSSTASNGYYVTWIAPSGFQTPPGYVSFQWVLLQGTSPWTMTNVIRNAPMVSVHNYVGAIYRPTLTIAPYQSP